MTLPKYRIEGDYRVIEHDGRVGIHATSITTKLLFEGHTLNEQQGGFSLWLMGLEDLATVPYLQYVSHFQPDYQGFPLMTTRDPVSDASGGGDFALVWSSTWYPQLFAKFYKEGTAFVTSPAKSLGFAGAGHFHFHRNEWVQLAVTWDKTKQDVRVFANGVLITRSNIFKTDAFDAIIPEQLRLGNTCFAFGELEFLGHIPELPLVEAPRTRDLLRMYAGTELGTMPWAVPYSPEWKLEMDNPLSTVEDLEAFYVQGCTEAVGIDEGTLLVETPPQDANNGQVYLWTRKSFEGDLAMEFEFMPCKHNGLSLLMLQASGMQREDFMKDYPLRTTGNMSMVYGENVRGYHWEFFREMDDTRNDVATNALIKAPWQRPLGYSCLDHPLEQNRWHRVRFQQDGPRLRASINNTLVFDVEDPPFTNSGDYYQCGHIALRCMIKTKNRYRNLKVWNRGLPFTITDSHARSYSGQ